jgi:hypothetical protein
MRNGWLLGVRSPGISQFSRVHPARTESCSTSPSKVGDRQPKDRRSDSRRRRGVDIDLFLEQDYVRSHCRVNRRSCRNGRLARHRSMRCLGRNGSKARPSLPITVASSPPCCSQTSRCARTTTRSNSITWYSATTAAHVNAYVRAAHRLGETSPSLTRTATASMSSCSSTPTCTASTIEVEQLGCRSFRPRVA